MTPTILNMKNVLFGDLGRLRFTRRYNTFPVHNAESVAEHSYYVAIYAMLIHDWCQWQAIGECDINRARTLERALMHDVEEAVTGDFPRHFKHSSTELHDMLKHAAGLAMRRLAENVSPDAHFADVLTDRWRYAKDETGEGRIVEFADFLSVLSYFLYEYTGGNWGIMEHAGLMQQYITTFKTPEYAFIEPLVNEVQEIMQELFDDHRLQRCRECEKRTDQGLRRPNSD